MLKPFCQVSCPAGDWLYFNRRCSTTRRESSRSLFYVVLLFGAACALVATTAAAQPCPEEPPLKHYTGAGQVVCPCFVAGEEAGAVFTAPPEHYPIEILRIGIGWGSQLGGAPQQLEEAINVYEGGLPDPGTPIFALLGPVLVDGYINEFDIEGPSPELVIDSGPFTVTLKFAYDNAGDPFAPSVVHDNNGCQAGKNVVFAIPGGWSNACSLGVSGDWVFFVVYRQMGCGTGIGDEFVLTPGAPAFLMPASPNPFSSDTRIEFVLSQGGRTTLTAYDPLGRRVAQLADRDYAPGRYILSWDGRGLNGTALPSGVYFLELRAGPYRDVKKVLFAK